MEYRHNRKRRIVHVFLTPIIYLPFLPFLILDLAVECYHRICFPLFDLPYIKRSAHIRFDRFRLPYLKWYERINCLYCEYANGLMSYVSAIVAQTERYWCGIKHREDAGFRPPAHHKDFLPYGDQSAFEKFIHKKDGRDGV